MVPKFFLHLHFVKTFLRFTENFSVLQNFFKILPKYQNISLSVVLCFFTNFSEFLEITRSYLIIFLKLFQRSSKSNRNFRKNLQVLWNYFKMFQEFSQDFYKIITLHFLGKVPINATSFEFIVHISEHFFNVFQKLFQNNFPNFFSIFH